MERSKEDNPYENGAWCLAPGRHWINSGEVGLEITQCEAWSSPSSYLQASGERRSPTQLSDPRRVPWRKLRALRFDLFCTACLCGRPFRA